MEDLDQASTGPQSPLLLLDANLERPSLFRSTISNATADAASAIEMLPNSPVESDREFDDRGSPARPELRRPRPSPAVEDWGVLGHPRRNSAADGLLVSPAVKRY